MLPTWYSLTMQSSVIIVQVISKAEAAAANREPQLPGAPPLDPKEAAEPDPYEILGVDQHTPSADIRKRYWRLSLLVHPDKCSHSGAQSAFQAVSKAAGVLGDAAARKRVDERKEEMELRRMAVAAAAVEERARAWRVARGEETAEAAAAAAAALLPAQREEWMTALPPEKKLSAAGVAQQLSQRSVTAFSLSGVKERGDTTGWTDTPQQKAMRAAGLLPAAGQGPLALTSGPVGGGGVGGVLGLEASVAPQVAAAIKQYSEAAGRQKSLLEQHLERQQKGGKEGKKRGREEDRVKGKKEKGKEKKEKVEKKEGELLLSLLQG